MSGIQPTSPKIFHTSRFHYVSDTRFTGTSLQACYPLKSSAKSDSEQTRSSRELLLVELDKRLRLGKDEELDKGNFIKIARFI